MKEIETDGFITREEDLIRSGKMTAKPIKECQYPKCEMCDEYFDDYCTVPIVVSKQIFFDLRQEMARMKNDIAELEKLVYDEILGDIEYSDFPVYTEEEYNELSPMQKYWYDKAVENAENNLKAQLLMFASAEDGGTVEFRRYAPIKKEEDK